MITAAETQARRRAAALASAADVPTSSPEIRAAAEMADAAVRFAELSAPNPPRGRRPFAEALDDAVAAALSGRPAPDPTPSAAEREAHALAAWSAVLRHLPDVPDDRAA